MLRQLRRLRSVVSLSAEYRIRNIAYDFLPVRYRSRYDNVFHCCVWKTASQWVRLILSDPRIYIFSGLKPQPGGRTEGLRPRHRTIISPVYCSYEQFAELKKSENQIAFIVVRDPRDILVSHYLSLRHSHPSFAGLAAIRSDLEPLTDEEGLLWTLSHFEEIARMLRSWGNQCRENDEVLMLRYEDLTGLDRVETWKGLLDAMDIAVPKATLAKILHTYRFEKLSGGRAQGIENRFEKYRKGQAGDWQNYFTDSVSAKFDEVAGDLVKLLGYE